MLEFRLFALSINANNASPYARKSRPKKAENPFNVLNGEVIAQCQKRHRYTEWLTFLKQVDRETPTGKTLHLIADNYATRSEEHV